MTATPPSARAGRDPNGPTWRGLALMLLVAFLSFAVVVAVLATVPLRVLTRASVADGVLLLPENETRWDPLNNISMPSGANATSVVARWATVGGYAMNLTVGRCLYPGCNPPSSPPISATLESSSGNFGWQCDKPWACQAIYELLPTLTSERDWVLSWEVYYNVTVTGPVL